MATSGSKDFSVTRSEIIAAALRKCGVYDQGEAIPAAEEADAAFALNVLVKEWSARGIDIWLRREITLFLKKGQQSYALGTDPAAFSYDIGEINTAVAGGFSGFIEVKYTGEWEGVLPSVPVSTGHEIGIMRDDGLMHWATVASFGAAISDVPTGEGGEWEWIVQVALDVDIPHSADAGNVVYSYNPNENATRPLKLIHAMRRDNNDTDVPVELIGENEYQALTRKAQEGPTTQIWYKPTLDAGTLYVWPTAGNNGGFDRLLLQAHFHPDDFDAVSDEPEFPIEWSNALIFHLAHDLSPEYGVDRQSRADLFSIAQRKLEEQLEYDVENASVTFGLDQQRAG